MRAAPAPISGYFSIRHGRPMSYKPPYPHNINALHAFIHHAIRHLAYTVDVRKVCGVELHRQRGHCALQLPCNFAYDPVQQHSPVRERAAPDGLMRARPDHVYARICDISQVTSKLADMRPSPGLRFSQGYGAGQSTCGGNGEPLDKLATHSRACTLISALLTHSRTCTLTPRARAHLPKPPRSFPEPPRSLPGLARSFPEPSRSFLRVARSFL